MNRGNCKSNENKRGESHFFYMRICNQVLGSAFTITAFKKKKIPAI